MLRNLQCQVCFHYATFEPFICHKRWCKADRYVLTAYSFLLQGTNVLHRTLAVYSPLKASNLLYINNLPRKFMLLTFVKMSTDATYAGKGETTAPIDQPGV